MLAGLPAQYGAKGLPDFPIYLFDVTQWLNGDNPTMPPPAKRSCAAT